MAEYIKNSKLREMIVEYNLTNIDDDSSWLVGYQQRMQKKYDMR